MFISSCRESKKIDGIYRYYWGKKGGYDIWVVDGYKVRDRIYNSFLYGGNEQRYPFNPKGEVWIDNAVSCEEFVLTLDHELNERHLMAKFGWTYDRSHDSSLRIEISMRRNFNLVCRAHEAALPKVSATDFSGKKEIAGIPDSISLQNIYRVPLGERNGVAVWIVDGYQVRAHIFPDFGFSGNDLVYHFIPRGEIWIDGQISGEETEYSLATELTERTLMLKGVPFSAAYDAAVTRMALLRTRMDSLIRTHKPLILPDTITRDSGIVDPREP